MLLKNAAQMLELQKQKTAKNLYFETLKIIFEYFWFFFGKAGWS